MSEPIKPLQPVQRFLRMLKPDSKEITNVYIYAIFNGLIGLTLPLGIQAIVNLIQGGMVSAAWIVLVVIVVGGVALSGVLQIFQLRIVENIQQRIFARAAFEFAYRIPKIRMEALSRQYAPELMNRFFDTMSIQKGLSKMLIEFSASVLQMFFGLILLSLYHPFFILFSMLLAIIIYVAFRLTGRIGLKRSLTESTHKYEVAYWLEELARTAMTFKLEGNSKLPISRTNERVERYLEAREGHFRILVRQFSFMVLFKVLIVAGLLAIGGILVMEQLMNIGQFVAAEVIILMILASVEKLVYSIETIYDVLTGLEKIGQVTDLEMENGEGQSLEEICSNKGVSIDLDDVSFAYPESKSDVLEAVSCHIEAGQRVMVTGPNNAGKSTLLSVMAGLYDSYDGKLRYEEINAAALSKDSLRKVMGNCLHHEQLFEGTILQNITLGREEVSIQDVKEVGKRLGLDAFIHQMPKGYETQLHPMGRNIPVSIGQLIRIARSVVRKPKLLLLENPFEHLDAPTRLKTMEFLLDYNNGWTLVVECSNQKFAKSADQIILMESGKILATGTHQSLQKNPQFQRLF